MTNYLNLSPIADDKTVLENPHKGWYVHFVDNGFARPFYRDSIPAGDHMESIPGIHHLYIRFDWSDIETEEGKCDWSKIDDIIAEWAPYGYKFSLRMCTCCRNPFRYSSVPQWLIDMGTNGREWEEENRFTGKIGKFWVPDYGDPVYMEKLESFMGEYGKKYNGDPNVEFIDVGTFGFYGEGHVSQGVEASPELIKWHMDIHSKYFPDTLILVNDDMLRNFGNEAAMELGRYCMGLGMGIRDDSAQVTGPAKEFGYDSLRQPELFDLFAPEFPVDLESTHQSMILPEVARGEMAYFEALRRCHATYAGFHGRVYDWYEKHNYFHDHLANLLGYWYFIDGVTLPQLKEGMNGKLSLRVSNRGFARGYHDYELRVRIGGKLVAAVPAANRNWLPERVVEMPVSIETKGLPAGDYGVEIGLFEGERPIQLGLKETAKREGGYYEICRLEIAPW